MNALAELRKRARTPANPANSANQEWKRAADSQDSQDSQGVKGEKHSFAAAPLAEKPRLSEAIKGERSRLLALAAAEWIDAAHVHRLHDADLAECLGLDDGQRVIFLRMLDDTASRHAGRVPLDDTAAVYCARCGPVYVHPEIAAVLPVVGGWPRALGCPWCFVRKAGGFIPRPPVTCAECAHYLPDPINPPAGMCTCCDGGKHYPMERHHCTSFQPDKEPTA